MDYVYSFVNNLPEESKVRKHCVFICKQPSRRK